MYFILKVLDIEFMKYILEFAFFKINLIYSEVILRAYA